MKFPSELLLSLVLLSSVCPGAELLVRTDVECRLSVDGKTRGTLKTGDGIRLSLPPGGHGIEAFPLTRPGHWQKTIQIVAADEHQVLSIPLRSADSRARVIGSIPICILHGPARITASDLAATRLSGLAANSLWGGRDWTLPSIEELHGVITGLRHPQFSRLCSRAIRPLAGMRLSL
jgi:hypothetical protein